MIGIHSQLQETSLKIELTITKGVADFLRRYFKHTCNRGMCSHRPSLQLAEERLCYILRLATCLSFTICCACFIISRNRSKPLSFPEARGAQIYFLLITYIRFSGLWILKKATVYGKQLSSSSTPYIRPCGPLTTSLSRERTEGSQYCSVKARGEEKGNLPETG